MTPYWIVFVLGAVFGVATIFVGSVLTVWVINRGER